MGGWSAGPTEPTSPDITEAAPEDTASGEYVSVAPGRHGIRLTPELYAVRPQTRRSASIETLKYDSMVQ